MLNKSQVRNILGVLATGVLASLASYGINQQNQTVQAQAQPKIVASHNVICDIIRTIAEDTVDLTCLIDGNSDPHSYRPTPSDRKAMESADLILYGGYKLEPLLIQLIEATETTAPKIAIYEQVVKEPILSQHEHEEHEEHSEAEHSESESEHEEHSEAEPKAELEPDPHVWHNIENVVAAIELIRPILLQINSAEAPRYLQNSTTYIDTLWQLDAWIDQQIDTIPEGQRILVTTHNSFNYYTQAYYLEDYKFLQGLSSDAVPTASQVRNLAAEIEQIGVPTIFAEARANDRVINNVARTAKVTLSPERLYADGLGAAASYIEMMSHNTCAIVNGLEGTCQEF